MSASNRADGISGALICLAMGACVALLCASTAYSQTPSRPATPDTHPNDAATPLSPIRIAIFPFDAKGGVEVEPAALTDQITVMFQALPKVTVVNRDEMKRVADEHKVALSGLVDGDSAVALGKFLNAEYVVVGRASRIGQTDYLVMKLVEVETTVQNVVSVKASAATGVDLLLERLSTELEPSVATLQRRAVSQDTDVPSEELRTLAMPLHDKVILIDVNETHVSRPLRDPAAAMVLSHRLASLKVKAIVPTDPVSGWKTALMQTGMYGETKVDFLLEGEGTSGYATEIEGMVSCRARVELRLIPVPGRSVAAAEKGVGASVDLVEALAAKAALEEGAIQACDGVIRRWSESRIAPP